MKSIELFNKICDKDPYYIGWDEKSMQYAWNLCLEECLKLLKDRITMTSEGNDTISMDAIEDIEGLEL